MARRPASRVGVTTVTHGVEASKIVNIEITELALVKQTHKLRRCEVAELRN